MVLELSRGHPSRRKRVHAAYYRLSRALDRGAIDLPTMHRRLRREFPWIPNYTVFRRWVRGRSLSVIASVVRALRRLKESARLPIVLASNISHAVWTGLEEKFHLSSLSDRAVLSYRVRALKPERAFLRQMQRAARVPLERTLFLDDAGSNVRRARRYGFPSRVVRGGAETVRILEELRRPPPGFPRALGRSPRRAV